MVKWSVPNPVHNLAYATGDADSGVIQGQLRHRARPSRAQMDVDAVWLVDVVQDPDRGEYRWTDGQRIPLV